MKEPENRLSTWVSVRLTPEERRKLEERAVKEKRCISHMARVIISESLEPKPRGKRA